jgi:hypothetical protein
MINILKPQSYALRKTGNGDLLANHSLADGYCEARFHRPGCRSPQQSPHRVKIGTNRRI